MRSWSKSRAFAAGFTLGVLFCISAYFSCITSFTGWYAAAGVVKDTVDQRAVLSRYTAGIGQNVDEGRIHTSSFQALPGALRQERAATGPTTRKGDMMLPASSQGHDTVARPASHANAIQDDASSFQAARARAQRHHSNTTLPPAFEAPLAHEHARRGRAAVLDVRVEEARPTIETLGRSSTRENPISQ